AMTIGALLIEHALTPEALDEALAGDSFAPEPLDAAERAAFAAFDPDCLPEAVRADVPDWCVGEFRSAFGAGWTVEGAALAKRPPLDLRANRLKATRERVLKALARTGAVPCRIAPDGIRIAPVRGHGRHPNVQAEP